MGADAEVVELRADRLDWDQGAAEATGNVVVTFGDQVLRGDHATWSGDLVTVDHGTYVRPDGTLTFDQARLSLRDRGGRVLGVHAQLGEATLEADAVDVGATWSAEAAKLTPCRCDDGAPAALSFRARRVDVVPDRVAVVHAGTVRVFDVPLLPVPYWREPLDPHRFRLLFPEVGYGTPGWSASLDGTGALGDWRFTGGPAWRQDRGFRGELAVKSPALDAQGQLGWDDETQAVRGAGTTTGGVDDTVRLGWDLTGQTDTDYADDYGVSWVERGVGYRESEAVFGWRATQVAGHLSDDGEAGELARARFRPVFGHAAWVAPWVGAGLTGTGVLPAAASGGGQDTIDPLAPSIDGWAGGGVDGGASGTLGALHGEVDGGAAWTTGTPLPTGLATGRAEVPLWTELGHHRLRLWPGAWAQGGYDAEAPTWAVGPAVRAQLVAGDAVVTGDGRVTWGDAGLVPVAALDVRLERLDAWVHAEPDVQSGGLKWTGTLGGNVGAVRTDELTLAWAGLDLAVRRFVTGVSGSADVEALEPSGALAYIGYDDGCSSLRVTGAWSPDRDLPDLGLKLVLRE